MLGRGAREPKFDENARAAERTRGQVDPERRVAAWVGSSIVFQGRLTSSEDLTIAGRVKGDIEVRTILPASISGCPWFGYSGLRLLPDVIRSIDPSKSTLIFTNTRFLLRPSNSA